MTFTRTLCPLCDWHPDEDDSLPPPQVTVDADVLASGDLAAINAAVTTAAMLAMLEPVESALKAHLETHELVEWVTTVTTAQRRAEQAVGTVERIRAFADRDQDGLCCSHVSGDLRRLLEDQ